MILDNFLTLLFCERRSFSEARFWQIAKSLVECGGLRVCELNPPHSAWSAGVGKFSVKNQGKNLPEQESCIPTGRAMAADPHHGLVGSPPFLPPFFRSISGRHFFNFCSFLASPGDPQNHQKSPKVGVGRSPFSDLMLFLHF